MGYSVGGTATNGVDYPLLSGSVTIPASAPSAVNVSIDGYHDGQIEDDETVTLNVSGGGDYQVDEENDSATLTVIDTDLDPVAFDGWFSSSIDLPIAIAALDLTFDANDDTLSLTTVTQGENGTVTIGSGGEVTYTPDTGFVGDDELHLHRRGPVRQRRDRLHFGDGIWSASTSDLRLDRPEHRDHCGCTRPGVRHRWPDAKHERGDAGHSWQRGYQRRWNGPYTPNSTFTGDDHFDYTVEDPYGHTATQTITVTVGFAVQWQSTTMSTTDVNAAVTVTVADDAFDPAGGSLTVTAVTQGAHGSVVLNQDGTVTYTPASGYEGSDSFTYTVTDGGSNTATGTISVAVGTVTSQISSILADVSGIEDELDNYSEGTPESILSELPGNTNVGLGLRQRRYVLRLAE